MRQSISVSALTSLSMANSFVNYLVDSLAFVNSYVGMVETTQPGMTEVCHEANPRTSFYWREDYPSHPGVVHVSLLLGPVRIHKRMGCIMTRAL